MKTRFAGLLIGAGFFVVVSAAAALAETHRLPLKFETGKAYTFQVTQSRQGPSVGSENPTQTDTGSDTGSSERTGSSSTEGRSQGASRLGGTGREKSIQYRIQVQNQTGDETTLEVTAAPDAASTTPGSSSSQGSSSQGSSTQGSSTQGSSSSSSRSGAGSALNAGDLQGGTWIVRVDGNGRVKNVSKRDVSGSTGASSSSSSSPSSGSEGGAQGSSGTEGSSRAGGSSPAARAGENVLRQMGAEGLLRSHLAFICGANLHEEELQPGKAYSLFAGESSLQGSSASRSEGAGTASRSGQDRAGSTSTNPGGSTASSSSDADSSVWLSGLQLETLQLRFDGASNQGGREVARFSVLSPRGQALQGSSGTSRQEGQEGSSGQSSRPEQGERGEGTRSQPGESRGGSLQGGGAEGATVGQAVFRKDDGILEQLTARIGGGSSARPQGSTQGSSSTSEKSESGSQQGIQSSSQAGGFLLSIRRTDSGAATGSDTGTGTRQR